MQTGRDNAALGLCFETVCLFPHGLHSETLIRLVRAEYGSHEEVVAVREGIVETAVVTRADWQGKTLYHRLVTDGYTMAAESLRAQRYMRLFAYLPAAFHPRIESALLISFGVGNTAAALPTGGIWAGPRRRMRSRCAASYAAGGLSAFVACRRPNIYLKITLKRS